MRVGDVRKRGACNTGCADYRNRVKSQCSSRPQPIANSGAARIKAVIAIFREVFSAEMADSACFSAVSARRKEDSASDVAAAARKKGSEER